MKREIKTLSLRNLARSEFDSENPLPYNYSENPLPYNYTSWEPRGMP